MVQSGTLVMPVEVYSSVRDEYTAATEGMGLADRSHLGRLKVSGTDALDLLNRLSTNKLDDLTVGGIQGSVLTTNKGRIIDLLYVLQQEDSLFVITGPETCRRVSEWIDFYTFVEEVEVEDVSDTTVMLSLQGPEAINLMPQLADVPLYGSAAVTVDGIEALALRTDFAGIDGFDIIAPIEMSGALWDALVGIGAVPMGSKAMELVRIEKGIAGYGCELGEDYNPLEAGLIDFISFNKGCYIGQEVVARLNTYDKVQRRLVRLSWDSDDTIETPSVLFHEGRQVGTLTSRATSLDDKRIGLGFVRKAYVEKGTLLLTEDRIGVVVESVVNPE